MGKWDSLKTMPYLILCGSKGTKTSLSYKQAAAISVSNVRSDLKSSNFSQHSHSDNVYFIIANMFFLQIYALGFTDQVKVLRPTRQDRSFQRRSSQTFETHFIRSTQKNQPKN